jgi:hypothetical protein
VIGSDPLAAFPNSGPGTNSPDKLLEKLVERLVDPRCTNMVPFLVVAVRRRVDGPSRPREPGTTGLD